MCGVKECYKQSVFTRCNLDCLDMLSRFSNWLWGQQPVTAQDTAWNNARVKYFEDVCDLIAVCDVGAVDANAASTRFNTLHTTLQERLRDQWNALYPLRDAPRAALSAAWQEWHTAVLQQFYSAVHAYRHANTSVSYASVARAAVSAQPLPTHTYPPILLTLDTVVATHAADEYIRKKGMPATSTLCVTLPCTAAVDIVLQSDACAQSKALASALVHAGIDSVTTTTPVFMTLAAHTALCKAAHSSVSLPLLSTGPSVTLAVVRASKDRAPTGASGSTTPTPTSASSPVGGCTATDALS